MIDIKEIYEVFKRCPNITIDSRVCPKNSIFFALKGDNFDGNSFAAQALYGGVEYAVVDDASVVKDDRYILVDDVLTTLQLLAKYHREHINAKIIAVTGTNGKTTTKELIASVLSAKYSVLYTEKNYNNHIGVPLTLLRLTESDDFGVVEIGANHKGEIASLVEIVQPQFGIITNFGKAHLEGFGSFEGVVEAKKELFDYIKKQKNGRAFINIGDDRIIESAKGILDVSYAINNDKADVSGHISGQNPCVKLSWSSPRFFVTAQQVQTHLIGTYNVENLLSAIVIGLFFEVEPEQINEALQSYMPDNYRSQYIQTENNDLIVDAYNANPSSMETAIRNFSNLDFATKTLILGDMLEMGEVEIEEHQKIIDLVSELNFDKVFLVGSIFSKIDTQYITFQSVDDLKNYILNNPIKNSAILLKGSNGIGLTTILEYLK